MKIVVASLTFVCINFIIMSLMFTGISDAKIEKESIVGMWLFDEGKGKVAKDSSGNGNDGSFAGAPKWVNAKFGKGLEFNGADDWLETGKGESLDFKESETFSIHAWVKADGAPTGKIIIWKGLGCSTWSQWLLGTGAHENGENKVEASFHIRVANGGAKQEVLDKDPLPENEWVHLVGTYDGSELKIYRNGKLANTAKATGTPWASPEQVYIAADPGCGKRGQWKGIIDEIAVFNVTLTEDDVASLAANGLSGALTVDSAGKLTTTWASIKGL